MRWEGLTRGGWLETQVCVCVCVCVCVRGMRVEGRTLRNTDVKQRWTVTRSLSGSVDWFGVKTQWICIANASRACVTRRGVRSLISRVSQCEIRAGTHYNERLLFTHLSEEATPQGQVISRSFQGWSISLLTNPSPITACFSYFEWCFL